MQPSLCRTKTWCSKRAVKILDSTGQKFVLDFSDQIFERLGVHIFVRLACFRMNETPNRTNFRPVPPERSLSLRHGLTIMGATN